METKHNEKKLVPSFSFHHELSGMKVLLEKQNTFGNRITGDNHCIVSQDI